MVRMPAGIPDAAGIYMIKVMLDGRYRIYIGEAANLRKRLRSYGGLGSERLSQRGRTTSNMKGRLRRACRAGGSADVHLLRFPISVEPSAHELDAGCKDCRITLERLALSCAFLRREPIINEHGFPRPEDDDPLL